MKYKKFKQEIERLTAMGKRYCPEIKDNTLDSNGAIFYMNGNDGTKFDWKMNDMLCEFCTYHNDHYMFTKLMIFKDGKAVMYVFKRGSFKADYTFTEQFLNGEEDVAKLHRIMNNIADKQDEYDNAIDTFWK